MKDVVVVGGGITGLSAAFWLKKAGVDVLLCESTDRVGGTISSHPDHNFPFEQGPNSLLDNRELTRELLDDLDLLPEAVEAADVAQERRVFVQNQLRKASPSPLHLWRILGFAGLLRLIIEPFISVRKEEEEESIADFFDRRIGKRARTRLVDAFVGGIYAGDSRQLSMNACFPKIVEAVRKEGSLFKALKKKSAGQARVRTLSFLKGMGQWPRALQQRLEGHIQLSTKVVGIDSSEDSEGFRVKVLQGETETFISTRHILLCAPAHCSAQLLEGQWSKTDCAVLGGIPYCDVATAGVSWPTTHPCSLQTKAFGFLAPRFQGLRILGSVFASAIFPHLFPTDRTSVNVFLGGATDEEVLRLSDEEIMKVIQKDLFRVFGEEPPLTLHGIKRWNKGIPQLTIGHIKRMSVIQNALAKAPGIHLAGNFLMGVSLHDAVASSHAAVTAIINHLQNHKS